MEVRRHASRIRHGYGICGVFCRPYQDFVSYKLVYSEVSILLPSRETQESFPPYNFYRDFWSDIMEDAANVAAFRQQLMLGNQGWKKKTKANFGQCVEARRRVHVLRYMMYKALKTVNPKPTKYVWDPSCIGR